MSGHSKWHKIRNKKGAADKARSNAFTKLLKAVTIAAQQGGDPDMNFSLRLAIEKAKAGNVPKDNIDRAIKKGTGEDKDAAQLQEAVYEAFGPGGVAMIIEATTDNTNRTVTDVKTIFSKNGGSMAGPGSVQWQFEHRGVIRFSKEGLSDWESAELALMDAGAIDIQEDGADVEVQSAMEDLKNMTDVAQTLQIPLEHSGLEWVAKETIEIDDETGEKVEKLLDLLDDNDDVSNVYTNIA